MSDTWKLKITEKARRRMAEKPAWLQRKESLELHERLKAKDRLPPRELPDRDFKKDYL